MEMTCEGCSNAAKRVLAKIGGMGITFMTGFLANYMHLLLLLHTFNGLFSRTTCVSWYQKGKTTLGFE